MQGVIGVTLSAAMLLAMGVAGVSSAQAAEPGKVDLNANPTGSITVNHATVGHTYAAVKVGVYALADDSGDGRMISSLSIDSTGNAAVDSAVADAAHSVDPAAPSAGNVIGWVAQHWLGYADGHQANNADKTSGASPYSGSLRKFVQKLDREKKSGSNNRALDFAGSANKASVAQGDTSAVFGNLGIGLYMIEDTTSLPAASGTADGVSVPNGIPMFAGTTIGSSYTQIGVAGSATPFTLGSVEAKQKAVKVAKALTDGQAVDGEYLSYKVTSKVPLWTGFDHYYFEVIDRPSAAFAGGDIKDLTVAVGGDELREGTDFTVSTGRNPDGTYPADADGSYHIVFTNIEQHDVDAPIVITYKMKVTNAGDDEGVVNSAVIEHSGKNDGQCAGLDADYQHAHQELGCVTRTMPGDDSTVTSVVYSVTIRNYSAHDSSAAVTDADLTAGSRFKVFDNGTDPAHANALTFKLTASAGGDAEYTYDPAGTVSEIGGDGFKTLSIKGLAETTYAFIQTKTPGESGKSTKSSFTVAIAKPTDPSRYKANFRFTDTDSRGLAQIDGDHDHSKEGDNESANLNVRVLNVGSSIGLPMTGGVGFLFLLVALAVVSGVVASTAAPRRRNVFGSGK